MLIADPMISCVSSLVSMLTKDHGTVTKSSPARRGVSVGTSSLRILCALCVQSVLNYPPKSEGLRTGARRPFSRREQLACQRLGFRRRGDVPLVAALEALPVVAARLVATSSRRRRSRTPDTSPHRLVPADEVAVRIVRAAVERLAALLRATLGDLAAVLRTHDARGHRARAATLRETCCSRGSRPLRP